MKWTKDIEVQGKQYSININYEGGCWFGSTDVINTEKQSVVPVNDKSWKSEEELLERMEGSILDALHQINIGIK